MQCNYYSNYISVKLETSSVPSKTGEIPPGFKHARNRGGGSPRCVTLAFKSIKGMAIQFQKYTLVDYCLGSWNREQEILQR
jgi:hypothetical protein